MKKAIFYLLACVLLPVAASADEGMWLVSTFRDVIYPQMKKEGLICEIPVSGYVAAVSAGIVENRPMLDLCK